MVEDATTTSHQSSSTGSGLQGVSQFAQSIFTRESVATVQQVVRQQASELKAQAEDGNFSLRLLALLGGVILMVVASMESTSKLLKFQFVSALIELYSFLFGIMIVLLESKNMMLSDAFQARIFKHAPFLKFLWGRGGMYFVVGSLQLYYIDLWNLLCGGYLCGVGALMIFVGQRTAYKLKKIRKSLFSAAELQSKFTQSDLDGDGGLNVQQFRNLTLSLGLDMTRRETEAAFNHMKKSQSEKLSYDEFHTWWMNTEMEDTIDENAFAFV